MRFFGTLRLTQAMLLYAVLVVLMGVPLTFFPRRSTLVALVIGVAVLAIVLLLWRVGVDAFTLVLRAEDVRGGRWGDAFVTLFLMLGGLGFGAVGLVLAWVAPWQPPLEQACLCGDGRRVGALVMASLVAPWLAVMAQSALSGLIGGGVALAGIWNAWRRGPA
jgi:hypothetical protein